MSMSPPAQSMPGSRLCRQYSRPQRRQPVSIVQDSAGRGYANVGGRMTRENDAPGETTSTGGYS